MPTVTDLPDVNVWLAFSIADHVHHERARRYWDTESAETVAFCRITALGFLRLSTNAKVMAGSPMTVTEAWLAYIALRRAPEIELVPEPSRCEILLEQIALDTDLPPRMWTDAYLAAFAISGGMRLVSFDADFARFDALDLLLLS